MENPYSKIIDNSSSTINGSNPYAPLISDGKNVVGSEPIDYGKTAFSKILKAQKEAKIAVKQSKKDSSFKTKALRTVNPINLGKGAFNIAKSFITDPKESARQAALGVSNGLSLGAVNYLERKAFLNEAKKIGMDEKTATSMAEKILKPSDGTLSAIRGGSNFAGTVAPFIGAEALLVSGLRYAAPKFVLQYGKTAKLLVDIGVFNAIGQTEETFKPTEERNRKMRALIDTGAALTFFTGGVAFRAIRGTAFKNPFTVQPVINPGTISRAGEVITADSLKVGAESRIKELSKRAFLRGNEPKELSFLKKNLENPDALYSYNTNIPKNISLPVSEAKSAVTIKTASEVGEKKVTVATNDLKSLQNYIKGSNKIDYKIVKDGLGEDLAGNKIMARHEFNPKTGIHTIYSTNEATASTIGHELGHYFDKTLTKTTDGLSRLLPEFEKNREAIEDALGSFAIKRLGGEATYKQISKEISNIAKQIIKESKALSATRLGGKANIKHSEQFADAISEILTRKEASNEAPMLSSLVKYLKEVDSQKVLGETLAKEVSSTKKFAENTLESFIKEKDIPIKLITRETKTSVHVDNFDVSKELRGKGIFKQTLDAIKEYAQKNNKSVTLVPGKDFDSSINVERLTKTFKEKGFVPTGKGNKLVFKPTKGKAVKVKIKEGKVVTKEVPKKLERTPTGKKPKSPAIRAEKITLDEETEVFLNTKVLSKLEGKERIGKSNKDILERSLSSKMTEKDFNNILNERFGNLSEDVVKAKRLINDRVQSIRDKMIGKDINNLSGQELKDVTMEYEKLIETVEVFSGMRTELSNSFRSLGIEVSPGENDVLRQVVTKMQQVLGKEGDTFSFLQKAIKLRENNIVDKYFTIWYPSMLSGPKTTTRNIVGNLSKMATETVSHLFTKEGRYSFMDRVFAMVKANKESWNNAVGILKGDEKILSKFEEGPAIREPDFKGKLAFLNKVEYVGRFMNAQDAYFSGIAKEGEIAAMRKGNYTYGLTDKTIIDKINEAVATAYGQQSTYRNQFDRTVMGELGRNITVLKNSEISTIKFASNFIIPFVRTIANITDRKIDYIPFLNMFRIYKGKATPFIERRARRIVVDAGLHGAEAERVSDIIAERLWRQQMGKMYMGLSVAATITPLAVAGRITGAGPKNKKERATLMRKGWRAQSIILPGGVVLPYQNLGPLSGILSMAGNISDGIKYNNDDDKSILNMVGEGMIGFMRGEFDQSFLAGISNIYDLVSPYSFKPAGDIFKEMALNSIPIPALWTQSKDTIFPERFEARTFEEQILNKIGLTGSLEPKLDAFGKQMNADLIWGLTPKLIQTDDIVLNWMDENNIFVGKPNRKQTIKNRRTGEKRDMTPSEYTQFLENSGNAIYDKLESRINSGAFDRYSKERQAKEVSSIVQKIRQREKSKIDY